MGKQAQREDVTFWGLWTPKPVLSPTLLNLSTLLSANPHGGVGEGWETEKAVRDKGPLWLHNGDNPSQMTSTGIQGHPGAHLQLPADNEKPVLLGAQ